MKILSAPWWTDALWPESRQQRHHGCRSTRAPAVAEGQEVQVRGNAAYRTWLDHADLLLDSYRRIPLLRPWRYTSRAGAGPGQRGVPTGAARAAAGGVHAHAGRPQGVIRVGARDAGPGASARRGLLSLARREGSRPWRGYASADEHSGESTALVSPGCRRLVRGEGFRP
jgi:hypothetical protein